MPRVLIVYKSLPAYRVPFFEQLRASLADRGIDLSLTHGDPFGSESLKGDSVTLPWATYRPNRFLRLGKRHAIWQPVFGQARAFDLVIVEQASRLLVNYPLIASSALLSSPKVALWGHGANLQQHTASPISEAIKRKYSRLPHWWFAYTEGSKARVESLGFPSERITVVQNAVDTARLREEMASLPTTQLTDFFSLHNATPGKTGLFIGSLYQDKRLNFLMHAASEIHRRDSDFVLLIAGDGPDRGVAETAARRYSFVRYLGRVDGIRRAMALRASDVILMPGLVGLAILDGFAAESPIVTTNLDYHSPEIEYLKPSENGVLLGQHATATEFAEATVDLLRHPQRLAEMKAQCRLSASRLTIDNMVRRFSEGVEEALTTRGR